MPSNFVVRLPTILLCLIIVATSARQLHANPQSFHSFSEFANEQNRIVDELEAIDLRLRHIESELLNHIVTLTNIRPSYIRAAKAFLAAWYQLQKVQSLPDSTTGLLGIQSAEEKALLSQLPELSDNASSEYKSVQNVVTNIENLQGEYNNKIRRRAELVRDYFGNLYLNELALQPPIVREVQLLDGQNTLYHAVWRDDSKLEEIQIVLQIATKAVEQHLETLAGLQSSLEVMTSKRLAALDEWHSLNQESVDVAENQLYADIALELGDVALSVASASSSGGSPQTALAYELVYRGGSTYGHMFVNGVLNRNLGAGFERKLKDVKLPDELIELRESLSHGGSYDPTVIPGMESKASLASSTFNADYMLANVEDGIKTAIGAFFELATSVAGREVLLRAGHDGDYWSFMYMLAQYGSKKDTTQSLLEFALNDAIDNTVTLSEIQSTLQSGSSVVDDLYDALAESGAKDLAKELAKDAFKTALINAGKSAAHAKFDERRFTIEYEKVLVDLKYLSYQNDANTMFMETRRITKLVDQFMKDAGVYLVKSSQNCCSRNLEVLVGAEPLSLTFDRQNNLSLSAIYSTAASSYRYDLSSSPENSFNEFQETSPSAVSDIHATASLPRDYFKSNFKQRQIVLGLLGGPTSEPEGSIDSDPSTVARIKVDQVTGRIGGWDRLERTIDTNHKLLIAALKSQGRWTRPAVAYCGDHKSAESSGSFQVSISDGAVKFLFQSDGAVLSDSSPSEYRVTYTPSPDSIAKYLAQGNKVKWTKLPASVRVAAEKEGHIRSLRGLINVDTLEIIEMETIRYCAHWTNDKLDYIEASWHPVIVSYDLRTITPF